MPFSLLLIFKSVFSIFIISFFEKLLSFPLVFMFSLFLYVFHVSVKSVLPATSPQSWYQRWELTSKGTTPLFSVTRA